MTGEQLIGIHAASGEAGFAIRIETILTHRNALGIGHHAGRAETCPERSQSDAHGSASGYVFVRNGAPMTKGFICGRLQKIGKRVDVRVMPHRLMHTFATQLLNVGCQVTSIQRLLGHSNLNTTMTYARAFDQTVMLDYFRAVDEIESQPGGSWYGLSANKPTL